MLKPQPQSDPARLSYLTSLCVSHQPCPTTVLPTDSEMPYFHFHRYVLAHATPPPRPALLFHPYITLGLIPLPSATSPCSLIPEAPVSSISLAFVHSSIQVGLDSMLSCSKSPPPSPRAPIYMGLLERARLLSTGITVRVEGTSLHASQNSGAGPRG